MDFGIGDAVVPEPDEVRLPTLIDRVPAPRIRAYPRVAAVAEKVQAMAALGRRNSRMKDFHDVGSLSEALASIRHGAEGGARRMRVIRSGKSSNQATSRIGLVIGPATFARMPGRKPARHPPLRRTPGTTVWGRCRESR